MGAFAHFGIEAQSNAEVDRLAGPAKVAGALAAGPKQSGFLDWAYLQDPDGHSVEFAEVLRRQLRAQAAWERYVELRDS